MARCLTGSIGGKGMELQRYYDALLDRQEWGD